VIRTSFLALSLLASSSALAGNADLKVSVEALFGGKPAIGEIVPLHVTVDNEGPDEATNVRATVTVPPGMAIVHGSVTPPFAANCTGDDQRQTITCSFGNLSTVERVIRLNVRMPAEVGTFGLTATAVSDTPDPNSDNNTSTIDIETENRTRFWVFMNPVVSRVDPGDAVKLEARLTNSPANLPGARFSLDIRAVNGTIETIDAANWQCTIDGSRAECVIAAPTTSCCIDEPLQITMRTNGDPRGGEARVTIDAASEAPGDFFEQAQAIIELNRHVAVTSTADSGPGTLRAAFEEVNEHCATKPCKIDFALPAPVPAEGWFTITPETPLPAIHAQRVTLDATTQTAFTGDTNPKGPEVAIDGRHAGQGLEIHANCHAVVRGLALGYFDANQALWMSQDRQVCIDLPLQFVDKFEITGNHIGVDPSGTTPWPNLRGLRLDDAGGVQVTKNVISENRFSGVWMWRGAARLYENRIQRNGASGIFFGPEVGFGQVWANVIDEHPDMGVAVARGALNVDIRANSMRANAGLGIDWGLDGPTPIVDDDTGLPSNPPLLLSARYDPAANETLVTMTLRSTPLAPYWSSWTIDVYTNDAPDGDGERPVGARQLQAVPDGEFVVRVPGNHEGKWINATSTRVFTVMFSRPGQPRTESAGVGDTVTSELSNTVLVGR
jgi:uncharacterized repeat protein (TIGR01451 family)